MTLESPEDFAFRYDINDVLSGGADDTARALLELWQASGGRLCAEVANFGACTIIMDGRPTRDDSPKILLCGTVSLAARRFGPTWAENPKEARHALSSEYRQLCARSYFEAADQRRPIFDLVHATNALNEQDPRGDAYQRVVFPFENDQGIRLTVCYSFDHHSIQYPTDVEQSLPRQLAGNQQNISRHKPTSLVPLTR